MAIEQFSRSLPMMLYRAIDVLMPRFRRIFKEFGLTEQQWRVLRVLWEQDQSSLKELAELTLIPAPSLVGVVDRLQASGLVERRPSDVDRRMVQIVVTDKAAALEAQIMPRVASCYAGLKQSADAETWNLVLQGLDHICKLEQ
jgi:homoprotocatechuate degradation regulator HpaR